MALSLRLPSAFSATHQYKALCSGACLGRVQPCSLQAIIYNNPIFFTITTKNFGHYYFLM